jgi:hypothetical protein
MIALFFEWESYLFSLYAYFKTYVSNNNEIHDVTLKYHIIYSLPFTVSPCTTIRSNCENTI